MGKNRLQLNPCKIECLWVLDPMDSGSFHLWFWRGLHHYITWRSSWIHNSYSKSSWQMCPGGIFYNFVLCITCTLLWTRKNCLQSLMLHLPSGIVQHTLRRTTLEDHPDAVAVQNAATRGITGTVWYTHVILLLCKTALSLNVLLGGIQGARLSPTKPFMSWDWVICRTACC